MWRAAGFNSSSFGGDKKRKSARGDYLIEMFSISCKARFVSNENLADIGRKLFCGESFCDASHRWLAGFEKQKTYSSHEK